MPSPTSRLTVFVSGELERRHLTQIRGVSPRLNLTYHPCGEPEQMAPYLVDVEVVFSDYLPSNLSVAPRLRWMQLFSAGTNHLHGHPVMHSDVLVTKGHVFGTPIAEYVFGSMLAFSRKFPQLLLQFQMHRKWPANRGKVFGGRELHGSTLGVVGYGNIGREVARIGGAFGMEVVATDITVTEPCQKSDVRLLPASHLKELLSASDFIVICVPLTPETEGLIGQNELRLMKPEAYLVNVTRAKVVDERALITALRERWIGGAGLDVFAKEPLSEESELFDLPNVILSPHISGSTVRYQDRITDLFCENLRHYLAGEPLLHVLDKERGY